MNYLKKQKMQENKKREMLTSIKKQTKKLYNELFFSHKKSLKNQLNKNI